MIGGESIEKEGTGVKTVLDDAFASCPSWRRYQAALLAEEGVVCRDACHVDLKRYQWQC